MAFAILDSYSYAVPLSSNILVTFTVSNMKSQGQHPVKLIFGLQQ